MSCFVCQLGRGPAVRGVVVAVMLMLVAPLQASAECAWVLWQRETTSGSVVDENPWHPLRGVPTSEACEAAQAETIKNIAAFWSKARPHAANVVGSAVIVTIPGWIMLQEFRCLPDTLDPRGVKERK